MKFAQKYWIYSFIFFLFSFGQAERYLTEDEALKLAFPDATEIEKKKVILTTPQKEEIQSRLRNSQAGRLYTYYVGKKDNQTLGYAVIDEVLGKHLPITYMVAIDPSQKIQRVEILVYREDYGWEIRQQKFRGQFYGKGTEADFRLNTDIRNIAGATISCRNLTDGIHNTLVHLSVILEQEKEVTPENVVPPASPVALYKRSQYLMGTFLEITLYTSQAEAAEKAFKSAFEEVARLEQIFTTYRSDSEISLLNRNAWENSQTLSPDAMTLILISKEWHEKTKGSFDITIFPLVQLWSLAQKNNQLPEDEAIKKTLNQIGTQHFSLEIASRKFRFLKQGMSLDFGGIGKGYALDQVRQLLIQQQIPTFLANFGGQILVQGLPPEQNYWPVEVKHPKNTQQVLTKFYLKKGSVSTSANYERGIRIQNKWYSHLIDPQTGYPVSGILSTTVIADSATEADALSTGFFVSGVSFTQQFLKNSSSLGVLIMTEQEEVLRLGLCSQLEKQ
ncbi:MAG: FAD:protein FMN transferase [Planctomycetota bacterium]